MAAKEAGSIPDDAVSMLGNAVSSVLGLAVLSGSFTYIVRALETIHAFEKLMTKDLSDKVFGQAGP